MTKEQEFEVNEFLTVHLEEPIDPRATRYQTVIYIGGRYFRQCKFLLLDIPVDKVSSFDEIDSIDEAAERLDKSQESIEGYEPNIPPEVEFWGHCSNLQVWYENDYDTRLLHSNLAFPLLKQLTEAGDLLARQVFKQEIAKRLDSRFLPTLTFLKQEGYFKYLSREELFYALVKPEQAKAILDLERELNCELNIIMNKDRINYYNDSYIYIENKSVIELNLFYAGINAIPDSFQSFKFIKNLILSNNNIRVLPDFMEKFTYLEELIINDNKLEVIPNWIENLRKLKWLGIAGNQLEHLPSSLLNLCDLKELDLYFDDEDRLNEESKKIIKSLLKKNVEIGP